jgi:hypothetical protein
MKKFLLMAALFCLLAGTNQVNAQLIIRNIGHAEIGVNPSATDNDTVSSGTVTLHDGFKVEKGATFAVYPSSF